MAGTPPPSGGDSATASTISPLTAGRAVRIRATSEARPRRTSSWSFVSSRPRTTGRSPQAFARASRESAIRKGDSKSTVVPFREACAVYQRSRSPRRGGGKPRNVNGTAGKPEIERIARTADGPGMASTRCPAWAAAATSSSPGSETSGVPASETRASVSPRPSRSRASSTRRCSLWPWQDTRGVVRPWRAKRFPVRRVSSQYTTAAEDRASSARGERSSRFPIGVATTRRRPIAAFSRVLLFLAPATIEVVFRGLLVPLVFAGVTLVPAAGKGAPPAPAPEAAAPATTPSGPAVLVDRIAAVVGDEIVLESEVRKLVAVRFLEHKPGETDAAYRDRVLDERIVDLLRERQLRRTSGFEPKPEEVEARVSALEARLAKERGIPAAAALAAAGTTRDELAAWVRRGLALDSFVRERLAPGLKLTEAELRAYYESAFRDAAKKRGLLDVPPFEDVREEIREVVRELKLNAEIERWTAQLRSETRVLIYRR